MTGGIRDKERGAAEESRRGVGPHTLEFFFGFFTRENECVRFLFVQAANVLELRARAETQGKSLGSSFAIRRGREREMVFVDVPPARRFSNATRGRKVKFTKRKEQIPGASALLIAHRSFSLSLSPFALTSSLPLSFQNARRQCSRLEPELPCGGAEEQSLEKRGSLRASA